MSELGTIRHMVFTGEDGRPWLGRVRLVGRSPGGRRGRWELMDVEGGGVVSRDIGYGNATEEGAIDAYQGWLLIEGFCRREDRAECRRIVARIVAAEGLREGARARDLAAPAAFVTGLTAAGPIARTAPDPLG